VVTGIVSRRFFRKIARRGSPWQAATANRGPVQPVLVVVQLMNRALATGPRSASLRCNSTGEGAMGFISFPVLLIILYTLISLRVLKQYERGVVFLLGRFAGVRGPGLTLIFVPFQQMTRVSLRTVTMQIPSQKIITKDNVSIDIAAVAYYHIADPEKAVIAIENVYNAINQISQTTVRNVVGRFSLDQLLSDTASINDQIKNVIDLHTEPWGTQVTAVEIKDITLPENMQRAMAKEAEAERERRAKIVAAEGEYQAAVKLGQAADIITQHPVALQLRTLQTMAEISIEKNSTIIFPAQFMTTVQDAVALLAKDSASK
jgi:regulator of protease activity HflC (stomatin/prohibitin superfamily)